MNRILEKKSMKFANASVADMEGSGVFSTSYYLVMFEKFKEMYISRWITENK